VPSSFLAASCSEPVGRAGRDRRETLVGRISIRHELNAWLAAYGGHIGYCVVPAERRKGYATEMLRQGLVIARAFGLDEVLVVCDVDNIASARVIEACGGEPESVLDGDAEGKAKRRYWIR
jgi:predicted acetyltransferase